MTHTVTIRRDDGEHVDVRVTILRATGPRYGCGGEPEEVEIEEVDDLSDAEVDRVLDAVRDR